MFLVAGGAGQPWWWGRAGRARRGRGRRERGACCTCSAQPPAPCGVHIHGRLAHRAAQLLSGHRTTLGLAQVMDLEDHTMGYNAATGEFCNMIKAGVIDPLKVRGGGGRVVRVEGSTLPRSH